MIPPRHPKSLAYAAWVSVCLIWGTTYLGIRVALETMPPFLMGGLRWLIAGALLGLGLLVSGARLPSRSDVRAAIVLAFFLLVLGNGGVVVAEQWVASGLTAVIIATSPFWMVGVESLLPGRERITRRRLGGLVLGFCGIVLLVRPDLRAGDDSRFALGVVWLQMACLGWAIGSSYSRRHESHAGTLMMAAVEMTAGGAMMLAIGTYRQEWPALHFSTRSATAFVYLATVGAVGGFASYVYALRHLPVSFVSLYSYINPIIAVILGVLILDEPVTTRMIGAAALVLTGAAVVKAREDR